MRFPVLKYIIVINKLFLCLISNAQTANLPYNHGKRELDYANYPPPASLENGRDFRGDYYNYYQQQQNSLDDPGFTKQQDDNQTVMFTKTYNENAMMGNTTNIHNFLEFNNPPGQMFHLIYVPMKLKNDEMTQAMQPQDNGARKLNYNQPPPAKEAQNLQYTGPQIFPMAAQNTMQQQQQPQPQARPQMQVQAQRQQQQQPTQTSVPPMPYYSRPSNNPSPFTAAGSMTAAYQQTYNTGTFPAMPLRAPPTQPQMPTRMEAPFIPSQFLGYVPQTPPPTMRPCANSHSQLMKPVHEDNREAQQAKYPASMGQLTNNAGGNMVFMPQNTNNDILRDMQRF